METDHGLTRPCEIWEVLITHMQSSIFKKKTQTNMLFVFNLHSTDLNLKTISESTKVGANSIYIVFYFFL